jgi:membrane-associated PAP2 superfamily phosphatase
MRIVEYMSIIIGLNFGYLVSFNRAAYTIYFLTLDLLTNGFDWSTGGV